jgi:serine/threonine-protein kinase
MYHLVTGYSPADTMFQINPISKYRPELAGSGLEQIILKCCRAMREERFQSCAELAYALDHPELYDTGEKKRKKRRSSMK